MSRTGLKVFAEVGDRMGAEVKGFSGGGVRVELDTCEIAFISVNHLAGKTRDKKSDRHACLRIGSELQIEVLTVDRSCRNPDIRVREIGSEDVKSEAPRGTGRILYASS